MKHSLYKVLNVFFFLENVFALPGIRYDCLFLSVVSVNSVSARLIIMTTDWIGLSYAALVSSGGIMGYVKAGSVTSLVAGLLFGLLAGIGAYLASQNPKNVWLSLGTSGTLAVVMGMRFLNSWKFMPAGLMALASGLMVGKIVIGMLKRPHDS
ncbi:transmembrane protein 14C-like isoform X1 [Centroberyx gerrardi]